MQKEPNTANSPAKIVSHAVQKGLKPLAGVKNIIVIASGKGGVGKSTLAVNLALALKEMGAEVGLLDADIYGPSQPLMLGLKGAPLVENKRMVPLKQYGLQVNSIGFLIESMEAPMVWRGPMVSQALSQLAFETAWEDLDYLIVDLPPGTGDIQLTLAQKIPVAGAVIITTPQDIAVLDAKKALNMFRKLSIPVLGVVENMSFHECEQCGHREALFGTGGGESMAAEYEVPFLGKIPLRRAHQEAVDGGKPSLIQEGDEAAALAEPYREIARNLTARLSLQPRHFIASFPTVVVQKT